MKQRKQSNKNGKKIFISFYMLLILFTLVTVASYTWFTISRTPQVSDMNLYVNSASRLELSLDPLAADDDWLLQLDLQDMMPASTPLRPITWVDEEQRFYAAAYGLDGRLQDFSKWEPLTDSRHANKNTIEGYYIKLSLFARATQGVDVSLTPAVEVDQGIHGSGTYLIGTPVWNAENVRHDNGGMGAETAVRVGIRITPVDDRGNPDGRESTFYIYEPNCDGHIDGTSGYLPTQSVTGAPGLVEEPFLIRQSSSTWEESDPVEHGVVVKNLGQFQDDTKLFTLATGEMVRIDLYIWLEGQDYDCTNQIRDAQILASIQFKSDPTGQSGLEPIE